MSRIVATAALGIGLASLALPAAAEEAYTTRIEPYGYYGASESIEHGVRVIRPLPPARHVIVNPGGRTPLSVGVSDVHVNEYSTRNNRYTYPPY